MRRILRFVLFAVLFVVMLALLGFVVQGLWNWLTPALFGWKTISYWQAVALIILSKLLFGGFRFSGRGCGYRRHRMKERWEEMTPEQREKFREWFWARWGQVPRPDSKPGA